MTCFAGYFGERVWASRYRGADHANLSIGGINDDGIDIDKGSSIILDGDVKLFKW